MLPAPSPPYRDYGPHQDDPYQEQEQEQEHDMEPQHAILILDEWRHRLDGGPRLDGGFRPHGGLGAPPAMVAGPDDPGAAGGLLPALDAALAALAVAAAKAERRARQPANLGRKWTADDDVALEAAFAAGETVDAIAARLGRSLGSVEARLEKLGRLAPEQRRTRSRYPVGANGAARS